MKLSRTTAICLAGLLVAAPAMATKVYKWVDENGVVNFSEHPPRNIPNEVLTPKIGHSDPVNYETNETQTPATEQTSAEPQSQTTKDPARCESARKNLEVLQRFGRVRVPAEDGSFTYLTEAQQQEQIEATQKAIDESC